MTVSKRERLIPCTQEFPPEYNIPDGKVLTPGGVVTLANGTQYTESEGHARDRSTGQYMSGGPFFTRRLEYRLDKTVQVDKAQGGSFAGYDGPVYCAFPTDAMMKTLDFDPIEWDVSFPSDADGATAISRCSPRSPHAQAGQALVETQRDGLPAIYGAKTWQSRALALKNAGDEYLNHIYGWVPLVNDVRSSADAVSRSGSIAQQWKERAGSNTRRGYEFPTEEQSDSLETTGYMARFPGYYTGYLYADGKVPNVTVTKTIVTKRWFRGNFTFAMPSSDDFWRRHEESGQKARELLGLQLNPELLWEVAPWSWAVDWFSNIGDVMSNITDYQNAGQVMRYGYMMEETIESITISQDEIHFRHQPPWPAMEKANYHLGPVSSSIVITTKRRSEANPFGFGIGWEGLSPLQLSIAAALGISRFL